MRLSNKTGIPEPMLRAIQKISGKYSKGAALFSVTELLQPAHQRRLKIKHAAEIIEDAVDLLYRVDGQADHAVVEAAELPDGLSEERLTVELDGITISGAVDVYHDCTIYDLKRTSVWSAINGAKPEWIQQLNIYAYLYRKAGFMVNGLSIIARYRDWSASKARAGGSYPRYGCETINLPMWTNEEIVEFIRTRINAHVAAACDVTTECSPEERWAKPATWAAMKTGRVSAVRVCHSEQEAQEYITAGKATHIEHRPGSDTRCEDYCTVCQWCPYFQQAHPEELKVVLAEYQDSLNQEVK